MSAKQERIGEVGYLAPNLEHVLISIYNPALLNPGQDFVQVAVTIDSAISLRAELNAFLAQHGVIPN